jgi:Chaperone for flagella basal body P-ring formation
MGYRFYSRLGCCLHWVLILSLLDAVAMGSARAACYRTPGAAIDSLKPDSLLSAVTDDEGYRVISIQLDPLLGQICAMITSCGHPAWPMTILQIDKSRKNRSGNIIFFKDNQDSVPVVHVGDIVRLWRQEDLLRIEASGTAEENGALGKVIRVRLLAPNTNGSFSKGTLSGIVRGHSDVEMQP